MPGLPNVAPAYTNPGSQWNQGYTFYNDDNTLMNLTGKSWEFVVRPNTADTTVPAQIVVTSSGSTAQGQITVNLTTSTILVTLTPAATSLLGQSQRPYTLWMDPSQTDATAMVTGIMNSRLVAAA